MIPLTPFDMRPPEPRRPMPIVGPDRPRDPWTRPVLAGAVLVAVFFACQFLRMAL